MKIIATRVPGLAALYLALLIASLPATAHAQVISEIRVDQTGTDTDEYFELAGVPGAALTGLHYIVIGDGSAGTPCGVIESVTDLSAYSIQADGFFAAADNSAGPTLAGYDALLAGTNPLNFENTDNVTHLLVRGFTGANGNDLDTNDDGTLDVTPWDAIVDCVAIVRPPATFNCTTEDRYYCSVTAGPDGTFSPGHVFLCAGWQVGSFALSGDTPGAANDCATPTQGVTWGKLKSIYR